jgi:hypothetical protein
MTLQEEIRQIVREEIAAAEQRIFKAIVETEPPWPYGMTSADRWQRVAELLRVEPGPQYTPQRTTALPDTDPFAVFAPPVNPSEIRHGFEPAVDPSREGRCYRCGGGEQHPIHQGRLR